MKRKLLIDTDLGADIDDALAIALALKSPEIELVGITTVFGNTHQRARMAAKLCSLYGEHVPVYAGDGDPYAGKKDCTERLAMYTDDLDAREYEPYFHAAHGALVAHARKFGDELDILLIGPMGNMARALDRDAAAMKKVRRVTVLGGAYFSQQAEWNILCDPEAAAVVLAADLPLYAVGLDVTRRTRLSPKEENVVLNGTGEGRGYIASLARIWMERGDGITLHDPLALMSILRDDLVFFKKQRVSVETRGTYTRGFTVNHSLSNLSPAAAGKEIMVASDVDERSAVALLLSRLYG